MSKTVIACVALFATLASPGAFAQEACPTEVTGAYKVVSAAERPSSEIQLGDVIGLKISRLSELDLVKCRGESTGRPVLYLNGLPLKDHTPEPSSNPDDDVLFFTLERKEDSLDAWASLLGEPTLGTKDVTVSVGYADRFPVKAEGVTLKLRAIPGGWFAFWLLVLALMVGTLILMAAKSNVLRADPIDLGPDEPPARGPYSLSRVQAAWWFFLVMAAYLFIGMVTGDFLTSFNGTALTLLGIRFLEAAANGDAAKRVEEGKGRTSRRRAGRNSGGEESGHRDGRQGAGGEGARGDSRRSGGK
jgi:hypothetical protein